MTDAYSKAVAYLARREHCRFELRQKLLTKGFTSDEVDTVLDRLESLDLLSEARYVEVIVRHRSNLGYGALRIKRQLQEMKIADALISDYLEQYDWFQLLRDAWMKKFNGVLPVDVKTRQKQINFLSYRGFSMYNIQRLLNGCEE
jgi:regulatory protein